MVLKYIDRAGLEEVMDRLLQDPKNRENLLQPDGLKRHVLGVGDQAFQFTMEILHWPQHAFMRGRLNPDMMLVAGAGHDFGKPIYKDQSLHGLKSADFIEREGLELGLADNALDIHRIAQIARSHGFTYEEFVFMEEHGKEIERFGAIDKTLLLPRTVHELIVTAADIYIDGNGELVDPKTRMRDVESRYKPGTEWAEMAPATVAAVQMGAPKRVAYVCDMVERLRTGKVSERESVSYGFL